MRTSRNISALLPSFHDSSSPTWKPRWRDAGASEKEVLTLENGRIEDEVVRPHVIDRGRRQRVRGHPDLAELLNRRLLTSSGNIGETHFIRQESAERGSADC